MATVSRGVVERENTIEENRKVLSALMRKNEFVDPSQKELKKLFRKLNDSNARDIVKDMKSYGPAWSNKTVSDRRYGPIQGIPSGSWWGIRMDCSRDRMHDPFSSSVQCGPVGAISICTSHSNEDVDLGELLTFTVQPHEDEEEGKIVLDKELGQGNRSLILNFENRVPIRIIRCYNLSNEFSPKTGYRYDGLYMVDDYWIAISPQDDTRCYKFALRRLLHQEPPPWKSKIPHDSIAPVPSLKRYSKNSNLQDQGGTIFKNNKSNANNNDTIISRCISKKRFQNRDGKTPKTVESSAACKERGKLEEITSDSEASQSSYGVQEPSTSGCKIISQDQKNFHASGIVTRRVSKKISNNINIDNKLMADCGQVIKPWNVVGGNESQIVDDDGGPKSPITRLQNTNISIRTDLYDSSHNLKQKCGSNLTAGHFKPRVLGVPRRELHFAGVDSSPGSSRTISSVKMERVKGSVENKRNLNHIFCQEKNKAVNPMTDIDKSSPVPNNISSEVNYNLEMKNKDLEDSETQKSRLSHPVKHACTNEDEDKLREPTNRNKREDEESSESPVKNSEVESLSGSSLSHGTPFKGLLSKEKSVSGVKVSWAESSIMMNSLTLENMLDIISVEKSSPIAKMLISNVIGCPAIVTPHVFGEPKTSKTLEDKEAQKLDPNIISNKISETDEKVFSIKTRSRGKETANSINSINSQKLKRPNFKRLENSRDQEVIEIVYEGEELTEDNSNSHTAEDQVTIAAEKSGEKVKDNSTSHPIAAECTVTAKKSERESRRGEKDEEQNDFLRDQGSQKLNEDLSPRQRKTRVSRTEDTVDSCDTQRNSKSRLTTSRNSKHWKQTDAEPLLKSSDSKTGNKLSKVQINTRSKCLQNTISHEIDMSLRLNVSNNENSDCNQSPNISQGKKLVEVNSPKRMQQSKNKVVQEESSKAKSPEKIRLIKRSGVRVKRKMEIANLFIDMNMSPRSQISRSKLRSKRSLEEANHLRRRSCPAVVNRSMKRRNDDSENHRTSPLKRIKKCVQNSSSVQERGLSLRKRRRNETSPSNNNNNNNNANNINNNGVKRVGKTEKIITNIKKTIKSTACNLIKNKKNNSVNGLRKAVEIPKQREPLDKTRSGRSLRSITVGRLGLRRALLPGTEAYARKKKKKKEKQKLTSEKVIKQKAISEKQLRPRKKLIEFALNKAKLDYKIYKDTQDENENKKKPRMVNAMTQCSLIPEPPPRYSPALLGARRTKRNNDSNLYRGSDIGSECIYSSHDSGMDQIKNEIIELIELKSEPFDDDDDVVPCDEEVSEMEENNKLKINKNSVFKCGSTRLKKGQIISTRDNEIQSQSLIPSHTFADSTDNDSTPRRGFIRYVAGPRVSAFVPVKSVEGGLIIAQLKSIGFKPIKPGLFSNDGFEDGSGYSRQISNDTPRIAYSSAVVKRGVHEEYDKYTSEENNVVQYMDSKLCYEDIENEDIIYGIYKMPSSSNLFVENMKFFKLGTSEVEEEEEEEEEEQEEEAEEEESNDNSVLLRDQDEDETEESSKGNLKTWQDEINDNNSSISEQTDTQGVVDSDNDVPWHGWRKIISNKETYFVGW